MSTLSDNYCQVDLPPFLTCNKVHWGKNTVHLDHIIVLTHKEERVEGREGEREREREAEKEKTSVYIYIYI